MDGLRIDREQIPAFARVLRNLDRLCVMCNLRTNHVGIAYESRKTRVRVARINTTLSTERFHNFIIFNQRDCQKFLRMNTDIPHTNHVRIE